MKKRKAEALTGVMLCVDRNQQRPITALNSYLVRRLLRTDIIRMSGRDRNTFRSHQRKCALKQLPSTGVAEVI